jgi:phosphopantetheine--protein transferase-like protein
MRVGIDVVDLRRLERELSRSGDSFPHRILTSNERAWLEHAAWPTAVAVAACLGAKEAVIKCAGLRPDGFRWQDIELRCTPQQAATSLSRSVATCLHGAMNLDDLMFGRCVISGAMLAHLSRCHAMPDGSKCDEIAAVWGRDGRRVVVVALQ